MASVAPRKGTVEGQSSGPRQLADAQDLALRRFTDGRGRNRNDGDRLAVRSEHLDWTTSARSREALSGDRRGQHSIRINDQYRICFVWKDGDALQVEVVYYH